MTENTPQGHFNLGGASIKWLTKTEAEVICGCMIRVTDHDVSNHTWTFLLDYSNCLQHSHKKECEPTEVSTSD